MAIPRHFVVLALALALTANGCSWLKRKKPQTIAAQAQAPTVEPATPPVAVHTPPAEPEPMPEKPASQTTVPKPKPRPKTHVKKTVVPAPSPAKPGDAKTGDAKTGDARTTDPPKTMAQATAPPRVVIQEGGAQPPSNQISTAMPHDQASDRQRTTQQLLDATDANLRGLNRALSADERSMVEQIRSYMQQARDAVKEGDLIRGHNLALKAHLLSDELAKR